MITGLKKGKKYRYSSLTVVLSHTQECTASGLATRAVTDKSQLGTCTYRVCEFASCGEQEALDSSSQHRLVSENASLHYSSKEKYALNITGGLNCS